jgi:hypothetical protein
MKNQQVWVIDWMDAVPGEGGDKNSSSDRNEESALNLNLVELDCVGIWKIVP